MVELNDLPGVGEKTAEKLRDAGFADMMRLATATAKELSVKAEIGEGVAEKVIEAARKSENIDFETALEVDERRKDVGHITVGSQEFNDLIGGGIETQSITEVFGEFGAFILALIFTLACLTTCVGLINSISQFFEIQFKKLSYKTWAILITVFSFLICNLGLNMILSISVPVLNAIYPESIVLIILGLTDKLWKDNKYVYPLVVGGVTVVAVIHALEGININIPLLTNLTKLLPLYKLDFAWLSVALVSLVVSILINKFKKC